MNETELNFFKTYLLSQKGSILNKTLEFRSEDLRIESGLSDDAEIASRDLDMSVSIYLHERDRASLLQIEQALSRISDGSYGICESCDESIGVRRLEARPLTTFCIDCMEESESGKGSLH